jgi:multiple sugar transport system substrate-binding protein
MRKPHRDHSRNRWLAAAAAVTLAATIAGCGSEPESGTPTITLYSAPEENLQQVVDDCTEQAGGRYRIEYRRLPRQADEQRVQMVRRLAAEDDSMDILGLDVTWTHEFASAEWILEWTGQNKASAEDGTLAGPLNTARYEDKLYAAPKNTNVQLLWYRTDVVPEPPRTWDQMIEMSQQMKAQGRPHRILTMGGQYEGLTVLFNTLVQSAGGSILSENGEEVTLDEGGNRALTLMRRFATVGVTSPSFSVAYEDPVRLEFQSGGGAFQLNWPYVYPALQDGAPELAPKVSWARYPRVEPDIPSRVTIGGLNLAISAYSRHPQESFEAALCLRNAEHQLFSAVNDGVPPTIEAVYAQPQMEPAYPMRETILEELQDAAVRPTTPAYQNVSTVIAATLSPPSAIEPQETIETLREQIQDALESKGVLP